MTVQLKDPAELQGVQALGADGEKMGKVDEIYLDNDTSEPEWAGVKGDMFGGTSHWCRWPRPSTTASS